MVYKYYYSITILYIVVYIFVHVCFIIAIHYFRNDEL